MKMVMPPNGSHQASRQIKSGVCFLFVILAFSAFGQLRGQGTQRVSVLVHLQPGADRVPVRQFATGQGGFVRYEYAILRNVINLRNIPSAALSGLQNVPGVIRVDEDGIVEAHMNDSVSLVRGLQSQITGAGLQADGSGVRICVVDTGIDSDHTLYTTRIDSAAGYDFTNDDPDPEDDHGHGSHVAGTAGGGDGFTFCSEPYQGVAPEATLIGVKVLDAQGFGNDSDVIAGIDHCADPNLPGGPADVINLSLGSSTTFPGTCDTHATAIAANNAVAAGVVVVSSSGNSHEGAAMSSPACGSDVIAVGATYDDTYPQSCGSAQSSFTFCKDVLCFQSCNDSFPSEDQIGCYSNQSSELDVTAPGCVTFSAAFQNSNDGIIGFCGTSMASPHVAGLAALLLAADPSLTPTAVRQCIRDGAIDRGVPGFDPAYGWGRIDVINSLNACGQCVPELCDGIDNNCDGNIDEGFDSDGDGVTVCGGDCDDSDSSVSPNALEACQDLVDNDCDVSIDCDDADCSTDPSCSGSSCDLGQDGDSCFNDSECCSSKCRGPSGRKTCKGGDSPGCTVTETLEVSCFDGKDNDCDGDVDCQDVNCAAACGPGGCTLWQQGDPCTIDAECCSGRCRGSASKRTCK